MALHTNETQIEKALTWVLTLFKGMRRPSGKPTVLHSIRVGCLLEYIGEKEHVVIAGLLHDILEDCEVKEAEVSARFGKEIYELVLACSYNLQLYQENKDLARKEMLQRVRACGRDAVVIKIADIIDNLVESKEINLKQQQHLFNRGQEWLSVANDFLENDNPLIIKLRSIIKQTEVSPNVNKKPPRRFSRGV